MPIIILAAFEAAQRPIAFKNVVPADYEKWLEDKALQGWQVDKIGQWSSVCMTLKRGEPNQYRFVYNMQAVRKKDYKTTYEQFGWEFVGQMASAFIWRKEYTQKGRNISVIKKV